MRRIKKAQARMWDDWMTIGEVLLEGRRWAMRMAGTNKPEGKGYVMAYAEWLKRYKVDDMQSRQALAADGGAPGGRGVARDPDRL
jgi:hypothetical protein